MGYSAALRNVNKSVFGDDKLDLQGRLEKVIDSLLVEFEQQPLHFDIKSKLAMVQLIGGYLARRNRWGDEDEPGSAGSAVRKYSGAFQTNVVGRRKTRSRSATIYDFGSAPTDERDPNDIA